MTATLAPVPIGVDGLLGTVTIQVPGVGGRHVLVGGSTGAGKSELLNSVVATLACRRHMALVGHDPKRVELVAWHPRMTTVALGTESVDPLLDLLLGEMERRFAHMARARIKTLLPSQEWPHIVAIFDELAAVARPIPQRYVDDKGMEKLETKQAASARVTVRHAKLAALLERARAAGIGAILCTQRPSEKVVPLDIRDNCRTRIAFGTESWEQSRMILGDTPDHVRPHDLPVDKPGRAWLKLDRTAVEFRGYRIPDEVVDTVAERTATMRMSLAGWPGTLEG
jgi:S-DNA-T family DNA segregation ATPase FtsK/SpoIIIE